MNARHSKWAVAGTLALAVTSAFAGQVTLYERPDFQGRYAVANDGISIVASQGFGNTAASIVVSDGRWEVCTDANFRGRCMELLPGNYPGIDARLNGGIASVREIGYRAPSTPVVVLQPLVVYPPPIPVYPASSVAADALPMVVTRSFVTSAAPAPIGRALLYEDPNFAGAWVAVDRGEANDLDWAHFTNPAHRATSIRVESGNWQFCTDLAFQGSCSVLGPGEYPLLTGALAPGISSARQVWNPVYGDGYRR